MQTHIPVQKKRSASKNYDVGDLILPVPGPNITEEVLLFTNLTNLTINSTEGGLRDLSILAKITTLNRLTIFGLSEANASIIEDLLKTPDLPLMTSLNRLTLSRNQLNSLPSQVGSLTNVAKLILDSNQLTSLPEELSRLTNLQRLQVSSNCLTYVPAWIGQLSHLTTFKAHTNKLTTIPSQINLLTNVRELELSSNMLVYIPDISMMHQLTYLDLSSNHLETLNTAPNLEVLSIKGNKLSSRALDGLNLPFLKELDIQDNNLTKFPDLHLLTALFKLNCFNNKLRDVPDDLSMLTSLRWLVIGQNSFKHLPISVLKLTFLEHLSLSKSKLQSVPREISALQKLKSINIMSNPISVLPDSMCLLRKLQSFPKSASKFPPHFEFSQRTAEFLIVNRDLYGEEED